MGCDIHGTIEVKRADLGGGRGLWFTVVKLDQLLPRDYNIFAHLFGVRHYNGEHEIEADFANGFMEPKELYANRGLPNDISDTTEREYSEWELDAHSESWAYHHEVESAVKATELETVEGWSNAIEYSSNLSEFFSDDEHLDGKVRWVVWFDN